MKYYSTAPNQKVKEINMKSIKDILHKDNSEYNMQYRLHASRRMFNRGISPDDVEFVLNSGVLIEEYLDDVPFPSVLVSGVGKNNAPLHIVAAINEEEKTIIVITAYRPATEKWTDNYSRRLR